MVQCVSVVCIDYGALYVVYVWPVVCLWLGVVCGVLISDLCCSLSCMFVICIWHLLLYVCGTVHCELCMQGVLCVMYATCVC